MESKKGEKRAVKLVDVKFSEITCWPPRHHPACHVGSRGWLRTPHVQPC